MKSKIIDTHDRTYNYWWDNGQLYGARKATPNKPFKINSQEAKDKLQPYVTAMGIDTKPQKKSKIKNITEYNAPKYTPRSIKIPKVNIQNTTTSTHSKTTSSPTKLQRFIQQKTASSVKQSQSKNKVEEFFDSALKYATTRSKQIGEKILKKTDSLIAPVKDKAQDVYYTVKENIDKPGTLLQTAYNGIAKHFGQDRAFKNSTAAPKIAKNVTKTAHSKLDVYDEKFAKQTRNGNDTVWWKNDIRTIDRTGGKYYIQESFPLTENMRWQSRNRGDRAPINSSNAPITTYRPFAKFENTKTPAQDTEGHINWFIGHDKTGKFKIGPKSKFGPGDTMTQVFYSDIVKIPRDKKGNYIYKEDPSNPGRYQVQFEGFGEAYKDANGKILPGKRGMFSLTPMTERGKLSGNRFGNVTGGGCLLQCGSEMRIVRGSIDYVVHEIEIMQKNHKNKPVRYFQLDNGSYNRALRTKNKTITAADQEDYDAQNTARAGGGHFMAIINK